MWLSTFDFSVEGMAIYALDESMTRVAWKKTWSDWKQNHFGRNASEHNFLLTMEDFDNNIVEENSPITTLYQWSERFDGQHASLIANYLMDYYGDKKPFNCYVFSSDGFKFETHKVSCNT